MSPTAMSPRERVLCALDHREPDRVPLVMGISNAMILPVALDRLGQLLGVDDPAVFQAGRPRYPLVNDEVLTKLGVDVRPLFDKAPKSMRQVDGSADTYTTEWGFVRKRIRAGLGFYYEIVTQPLAGATIDDLDSYPWPDPTDPARIEGLRHEAQHLRQDGDYAIVGCPDLTNIFELAWYLRGLERFLMDLVSDKYFAHALMRKLLDLHKARLEVYLDEVGEYLDMIHISDDLAMQTGLLISPAVYREMVKPYQAEFIAFIKEHSEARILYHCCGNPYRLLEDFIEIGIEVLNPVQVSAGDMGDTGRLKREFGNELSFLGGIDTQSVLPFGTPEEVKAEVKRRVRDLAPGGGYLLAAVHNIQNDVPPENVVSMFLSAQELGRYPLRGE